MGTKNDPGDYDCYRNAEPDEPLFVLLGRDPAACVAIAVWVAMRVTVMGESEEDPKIVEALSCLEEMKAWAISRGKGEIVDRMIEALGEFGDWQQTRHVEYRNSHLGGSDGLYLSPGHPLASLRTRAAS